MTRSKRESIIKDIENGILYEVELVGCWCNLDNRYVDSPCSYDKCDHSCTFKGGKSVWRLVQPGEDIHLDWNYRKVSEQVITIPNWYDEEVKSLLSRDLSREELLQSFVHDLFDKIRSVPGSSILNNVISDLGIKV